MDNLNNAITHLAEKTDTCVYQWPRSTST